MPLKETKAEHKNPANVGGKVFTARSRLPGKKRAKRKRRLSEMVLKILSSKFRLVGGSNGKLEDDQCVKERQDQMSRGGLNWRGQFSRINTVKSNIPRSGVFQDRWPA